MKNCKFFLVVLFVLFFISCSNEESISKKIGEFGENLNVVSWNVQTFFDAEIQGNEYSDFCDSSKWNKEKYLNRLERLCNAIVYLDADVFILEEIENENVIYDISNQLSGKSWNSCNKWIYSCFAKKTGTSIGIAVLSKYEITDLTTHSIDIRTVDEQPELRYLLKFNVNVNDRNVTFFANHWKSKSNGEEISEVWRKYQEALLVLKLNEIDSEKNNCPVVICGDFNKDLNEFNLVLNGCEKQIMLDGSSLKNKKEIYVYSGWFLSQGEKKSVEDESLYGSYYFKNKWEKIDNIFVYGNCKILKFEPCINQDWCNDNNTPKGYKIYTGEGYSDHLPIRAYLYF